MASSCESDRIDEYLLNRLTGEDKTAFEKHYFNCPACFRELKARAEVLAVIKARGRDLFPARDLAGRPEAKPGKAAFRPVWRWTAAAAVAAAAVVVIVLATRPPKPAPVFTLSGDDTVRGQAVGLVSPRGEVATAPEYLEWSPLAQGVEYDVSLFDQQRLWSATTPECRVRIPEDVRKLMVPGRTYSWQVKAFSSRGALTAMSSRQSFRIAGPN